ncbi:MAG: hypothetical protein IPJ34_04775 [Myxococcales bacterium]|nr:hypothetical protein [Myxococcales bacterium]
MFGGDKLLVRESLEELIAAVIEFRRATRVSVDSGDLPHLPIHAHPKEH